MSARMQYPLSQRRHTNIAVVRYQKSGVRLEIACYKNKVISYRAGTEDRLDEVLQVDRVFANVARGHVASKEDIAAVFGPGLTEKDAIKFMLEHGELQVAQQERTAEVDEISKDISIIISQKCVNTKTQRPFPSVVIEQALKSIGAGVKLDQPVKKQALALIHQLVESQVIPIARANMKIRCLTPTEAGVAALDAWCEENDAQVVERKTSMAGESAEAGDGNSTKGAGAARQPMHSLLILLQPNVFRDLDTFVKAKLPAGSAMHIVDAVAMEMGEGDASVIVRAAASATAAAGTGSLDADSTGRATSGKRGGGAGGSLATSTANGANDESEDDDGDEDGTRARRRGKGTKNKKKGKGGRRGDSSSSSSDSEEDEVVGTKAVRFQLEVDDDDDSDDDAGGRRGKKGKGKKAKKQQQQKQKQKPAPTVAGSDALTAELVKLGLDPVNDLDDDDSADDTRGKGKNKKNKNKKNNAKGGGGAAAQANKEGKKDKRHQQLDEEKAPEDELANNSNDKESDSDEELTGNRRQRKKNTHQQQQQQYNPSDEDFDYGDDDDNA